MHLENLSNALAKTQNTKKLATLKTQNTSALWRCFALTTTTHIFIKNLRKCHWKKSPHTVCIRCLMWINAVCKPCWVIIVAQRCKNEYGWVLLIVPRSWNLCIADPKREYWNQDSIYHDSALHQHKGSHMLFPRVIILFQSSVAKLHCRKRNKRQYKESETVSQFFKHTLFQMIHLKYATCQILIGSSLIRSPFRLWSRALRRDW